MIINALDYSQTLNPLTCTVDGQNMETLVAKCHLVNVTAMYDNECTKGNVRQAIRQVGRRCQPGDTFVYYYSGHGARIETCDAQEDSFCFVNNDGQVSEASCMTDDEFSELIWTSFPFGVRILILTDTCSGAICDFKRGGWEGREAISITGSVDAHCGDTDRGGTFTHAMLCAVSRLQLDEVVDYSVGTLYNETVDVVTAMFRRAQDITIQCAPGVSPAKVPWPLAPREQFTPPFRRRLYQ